MGNCFSVDDEEKERKKQRKKETKEQKQRQQHQEQQQRSKEQNAKDAGGNVRRQDSEQDALAAADNAVERAEILKNKGNDLFRDQKYERALDYYTNAIDLNPKSAIYFSNRARCFKTLKRYQEAVSDCEKSAAIDDTLFKAYLIKGCALLELSKQESTSENAQKGVRALRMAMQVCRETKNESFLPQLQTYYRKGAKLTFVKRQQEHQSRYEGLSSYFKGKLEENPPPTEFASDELLEYLDSTSQEFARGDIPDHLTCNITFELLSSPIVIQSGHTYEEEAIEAHFKQLGLFDPSTRKPCDRSIMHKNHAIDEAVNHFIEKHPWAYEPDEDDEEPFKYTF